MLSRHTHRGFLVFAACSITTSAGGQLWPQDGFPGILRIGSATAAPRETVRLPVTIESDLAIVAFSAVVDFDETVLAATGVEQVFRADDGWGFFLHDANNSDDLPGDSGVEEGFVVASGVFSFLETVSIPAGVETEVVAIDVEVRLEAPDGDTQLAFVDGARTIDPLSGADIVHGNYLTDPGGESQHPDSEPGTITVRGPPILPPDRPARMHLSLGGLGDLVATIEGDGEELLSAALPAGDVDGDGREDLLLRFQEREPTFGSEDRVVLLYGMPGAGGPLDPFRPGSRRTVIPTGPVSGTGEAMRTQPYLAAGEDIDGDGRPDFLVASSFEVFLGEPALLLICGGAFGRPLPREVTANMIGDEVRGSLITDRNPTEPNRPLGVIIGLSPDINGDGFGEVLIAETASLFDRKRCYVLHGSGNLPQEIDLQNIGIQLPGFILEITGEVSERGIRKLAPLGDVDGDGLGDLGVLVSHIRGSVGDDVFILFGRESFPEVVILDDMPPDFGMTFDKYEDISGGGDIDGDGRADPILSQIPDGMAAGWAHVMFGRARDSLPEVVTFDSFRSEGLGIRVQEPRDVTGSGGLGTPSPRFSLSRGRDLNGDGRAEILLATPNRHVVYGSTAAVAQGGAGFLVRGGDELPASLRSDDIPKEVGIRLDGIEPLANAGTEAFLIDDFDGDGLGDLMLLAREVPCEIDPFLDTDAVKASIVSGRGLLDPELPPRVEMVFPRLGSTDGGDAVVLLGRGFGGSPIVFFGDKVAEVKQVIGDGILLVEAPRGNSPIDVPVTVITAGGPAVGDAAYGYFRATGTVLVVESEEERTQTLRHLGGGNNDGRGIATGDFNGDGHVDIAIVNFLDRRSTGGDVNVELHIVFGKGNRGDNLDLDHLSPPDGVTLRAESEELGVRINGELGALHSGGDVNGDGHDDLVLSVFERESRKDQWRVFLGREEFPAGVSLAEVPGTIVCFSSTVPTDRFSTGGGAAIVRDLDGDEIDDLLLTSNYDQNDHLYILRGGAELPASIDLDTIAEDGLGSRIDSEVSLSSVAGSAGDFNNDGLQDVFFAGKGRLMSGAMLVLYGGEQLFPGMPIQLGPEHVGDFGGLLVAGTAILSAFDFYATLPGDLDGDGDDEIFFHQDNAMGCTLVPRSGEGFLFDRETILREGFVREDFPIINDLYRNILTGPPDFAPSGAQEGTVRIRSPNRNETFGASSAAAGDFNGDGFDDLVVGSLGNRAYVIYGGPEVYSRPLVDLANPLGRALVIEARAQFVAGGFDWDEDGVDDILIGWPTGRVDVVFGKRAGEAEFVRGDADGSQEVSITDAIFTLGYLFLGSARPDCLDALDANDDGQLIITDAIYMLAYLFLGGPPPLPPYPEPGLDPTPDGMLCME
jgi:hypothetical protein